MTTNEYNLAAQQLAFDKKRHQDFMELEWAKLHSQNAPDEEEVDEILRELAEEEEEECDCPICRMELALEQIKEMLCRG